MGTQKANLKNHLSKTVVLTAFLCLSFATTVAHDWFVDSRFQDINKNLHAQVMENTAPAPIQYRIFVYYIADWLMQAGMSFKYAYLAIRMVFTFLSSVALYYLFSMWFAPFVSFAGVLYLFAVLPITYIRYYMQPMDIPNLFFTALGSIIIIKRKDALLFPLLFIAMLNRETAIFLVFLYLFYRWDELKPGTLVLRTGLLSVIGIGTYAFLRKAFAEKQYYSDLYYLAFNAADIRTYLYVLGVFGPFLFLSFNGISAKPKFIRRSLLIIPFFIIIHYTMTVMAEPRLWLPLIPFIIAGGLWVIVPEELKLPAVKEKAGAENGLSRYSKPLYGALLAVFLVFFSGFFMYYKNAHLKDRGLHNRIEKIIEESRAYASVGLIEKAVEELNKVLMYDPAHENAHYELALLYEYNMRDPGKALYHFNKCLELNAHHLYSQRINDEIERITYYMDKADNRNKR